MEFGILGQLEVRSSDATVMPVYGQRQRRILAMLLVNAGQLVTHDRLSAAIWDDPPTTAKRQLQNCVSDLRRQLSDRRFDGIVVSGDNGYRIDVDHRQCDLLAFRRLVNEAHRLRAAGVDRTAGRTLRDALGLWRGPALAGFTGRVLELAAVELEEQRLSALESCVEVELRLGRQVGVATELVGVVATHPLRERLVGFLMLAMYRSGRKAEAVAAYRGLRSRLIEELGLDPSPALRELHTAILRDRADLAGAAPAHLWSSAVLPRQKRWRTRRPQANLTPSNTQPVPHA